MKKILMLCSVILVLAIVITAFTACGDKTEDNTTTEASASVGTGFIAEIGANEAIIKKDGDIFQTLKYPINSKQTFDLAYAKEHNEFLDMNFDGIADFYIALSSTDGVINYYCWLYNDTTKKFDFSAALSALKNISVDADNHRIYSTIKTDDGTKIVSYHWVDGSLQFDKDYSEEPNVAPEDVTKIAEENAIGKETKPATTDKSDKEETTKKNSGNNSSDKGNDKTTKPNKPANTTTTAPNDNVIILETGDANSGGWF